jgi:hypothetical protein
LQPRKLPSLQPSRQPSSIPTSQPTIHQILHAFEEVSLNINSTLVRTAFSFSISFRVLQKIFPNELLLVRLPRFTRRFTEYSGNASANIPMGKLILAPSHIFDGRWIDGSAATDGNTPFANSTLVLKLKYDYISLEYNQYITVTIYQENGIGAVCGHLNSTLYNSTGCLF